MNSIVGNSKNKFALAMLKPFARLLPSWVFIAIIVLFAFAPFAWLEARPLYYERVFFKDVPREDYLVSLQNNRSLGCLTAPIIQPEILVYGDSHVYANVDYQMLGKAWGEKRVGGCPLPGGYIWSIQSLIKYIDQFDWTPKIIVYMTNYRQFRRTTGRAAFEKSHAKILFNPNLKAKTRRKWVKNYKAGRPPFGRSVKSYDAQKQRHRGRVMELSVSAIRNTLDAHADRYLTAWRHNIEHYHLDDHIDANIAQMCETLTTRGIKLYVVHTPESEFLESLYRREQFETYLKKVKSIPCTERIEIGSLKKWDIDLRHYVNRRLHEKFDYSKFDEQPHPDVKKWNIFFDADHMNPYGAEIATQKIIEAFPELKANKLQSNQIE